MKNKKYSRFALGFVALSMAGLLTYAAIPGDLLGVRTLNVGPRPIEPSAQAALTSDVVHEKTGASTSLSVNPSPRLVLIRGVGIDTAADAFRAPLQTDGPTPLIKASTTDGVNDDDCRPEQFGRKTAPTRETLIAFIQTNIDGAGGSASIEQMRTLVQLSLIRSGADETVKLQALQQLASNNKNNIAHMALSRPFDLKDTGVGYANGYNPCENPASLGGGNAFGQGPFASNFTTINPVPVVAAKMIATTEGGAT